MCFGNEMEKKNRIKKAIFIPILIIAGIFIFGTIVMCLWNTLLPEILGIHTITFWQSIGILILSKILFGGFLGGHRHYHGFGRRHGIELTEKWLQMTPEERDKMRDEWKTAWKGKFESKNKSE